MTGRVFSVALCASALALVTPALAETQTDSTSLADAETDAPRAPARFAFGSYGRVRAAMDPTGHSGGNTNVVAHGTRYDLDNYAELEFRRHDRVGGSHLAVVATLAVAGDLFHYSGVFDDHFAVRNLYAEVDGALVPSLMLWAGSRMVRGDDVYLLNFWPLDNLNLVGGGAALTADSVELKAHLGSARPRDPFYLQTVPAEAPRGFVPSQVDLLDRPRAVAALRATWWGAGRKAARGLKLVGYGEAHYLPAGRRQTESNTFQTLPRGRGLVAGLQLGGYRDDPRAFLNVFLRYSRGVAVYDPLGTPDPTGRPPSGDGAVEYQLAIAGNLELGALALQVGGYVRRRLDPSASVATGGALDDGAVDLRPTFWLGQRAGLAVDVSYQGLATRTLDPATGEAVQGRVTKLAVIPFYSVYGRGSYTRPHLQIIYALSIRDAGARRLYPALDRRSRENIEQFLGLGVEWWFDSTSY